MYVLEWRTVSALTRGLFWCSFPELWSNKGNKHQNNTRVSTEYIHYESTYIILFVTRHNESINDDKNDNLYTLSTCPTLLGFVLLMMSQSIADDVTMTRQLWCVTWIVISNSLDIDFIHGNIHGRSCKNVPIGMAVNYYIVDQSIVPSERWQLFKKCHIQTCFMNWYFGQFLWNFPNDDMSTLAEVMAWCHHTTSHYMSQCWPRSLSPYGITMPQWVNMIRNTSLAPEKRDFHFKKPQILFLIHTLQKDTICLLSLGALSRTLSKFFFCLSSLSRAAKAAFKRSYKKNIHLLSFHYGTNHKYTVKSLI